MHRIYIVERPVTTHTIVVRSDRSVSARLANADTGHRYPWVAVTRAQAARWIREAHASVGNPVARVGDLTNVPCATCGRLTFAGYICCTPRP